MDRQFSKKTDNPSRHWIKPFIIGAIFTALSTGLIATQTNLLQLGIDDSELSKITDIVLITGQSNALGAHTKSDPVLDATDSRVYAYTNRGWRVADLKQNWDSYWPGASFKEGKSKTPSNNFGFHFAKNITSTKQSKSVGFILITAPGMAIDKWDKGSELYERINDKVSKALQALPHKHAVDGILWHQGETDWGDTDYYSNKLSTLLNNFRSEPWFNNNKPFIAGETVDSPVNKRLMALNTDLDPWTGCIAAQGLETRDKGLHFSSKSLRLMGKRYAAMYLQMYE